MNKQKILSILDSLKIGLGRITASKTEFDDNGCEYGYLEKETDGKLYLTDLHNPIDVNPRKLLVESLPVSHIIGLCKDVLEAKLRALSNDYRPCCERGDVIEWADDAQMAISDTLTVIGIDEQNIDDDPDNREKKIEDATKHLINRYQIYSENCMGEFLAEEKVGNDLTFEDAFNIYIRCMQRVENDRFYANKDGIIEEI